MVDIITREELDRAFDSRFSPEVKSKLACARVAVAGLGGLGSNIAVMLARSGVGHLFLVDFDTVDVTNLNRQVYNAQHIGKPKTEAIKDIIAEINPYLDIKVCCKTVDENNAEELFGSYDIVCEAFDKAENKSMLISALLSACPEMCIISGNGMAGYGNCNDIQTKKIFERLYVCGDGKSGIEGAIGLMAPRVSVCAGHQADKVIELILGDVSAAADNFSE